jgi:hypothetical protein
MDALRFPFWAITRGNSATLPASQPCDSPDHVVAFSSTTMLAVYLADQMSGSWTVSAIRQQSELRSFVAELDRDGATGICLDPESDGSGGTNIPMSKLLSQ